MPVGDVGVSLARARRRPALHLPGGGGRCSLAGDPEGSLSGYGGAPGSSSAKATGGGARPQGGRAPRPPGCQGQKPQALARHAVDRARGENASLPYDEQRVYCPTALSRLGRQAAPRRARPCRASLRPTSHRRKTDGLRHYTGGGGSVVAGDLICNDVWAVPDVLHARPHVTHVLAWQFGVSRAITLFLGPNR